MSQRHGVPVPGEPQDGHGLALDVRDTLEEASRLPDIEADVDEHWSRGRRRRRNKQAGAGVAAALAGLTTLALVWQSGLAGGASDPGPTTVAAVPDGYTTFVFAAPDVPSEAAATEDEVRVPAAEELAGTAWVLADRLWGSDERAEQVIGTDTDITLTFRDDAWGYAAGACPGGWFQESVEVAGDGRFAGGRAVLPTTACEHPDDRANSFWAPALERGGYVRALGDGWLLVSVLPPTSAAVDDAAQPTPGGEAAQAPTRDSVGPVPDEPGPTTGPTAEPTGSVPQPAPPPAPVVEQPEDPAEPLAAPTTPTTAALPTEPVDTPPSGAPDPPTDSAPPPSADPDPDPSQGAVLEGFTGPDEVLTSPAWPGSGGDLRAPTVRFGPHDGFDRVVLDLAGTTTPTWYARYTDLPLRDGSGLPAQVAGDSVLELVITGMAYPEPGDAAHDGGDLGLDTHRLTGVDEVIRTPPFEGQVQLFVGVAGESRPYRVLLLPDPLRLVVDVQTG